MRTGVRVCAWTVVLLLADLVRLRVAVWMLQGQVERGSE